MPATDNPAEDERESEGRIHRVDTVPPPADGESHYSAQTVVREAPPEVLEAIRRQRNAQPASSPRVELPPPPRLPSLARPPTPPDFAVSHEPLPSDDEDAGPNVWRASADVVEAVRRQSAPVPPDKDVAAPGAAERVVAAEASAPESPVPDVFDEAALSDGVPDLRADRDVDDQAMTQLHASVGQPVIPMASPLAPLGRLRGEGGNEAPWWATPAALPAPGRNVFAWTIAVAVGLTVLVAMIAWLRAT